jgi:hypothetical protein
MFSVYGPTQGRTRNLTGESTFLLDRQLTKPWDAFVEYAGDFPEFGGPRHLLHFGTALKIAKQQQIDFHVGVGLSSAAVDHLIGIGYSFRIQAIRRGASRQTVRVATRISPLIGAPPFRRFGRSGRRLFHD